MAAPVIKFKRGANSSLPALKAGEPAFVTDEFDFYIGLDNDCLLYTSPSPRDR